MGQSTSLSSTSESVDEVANELYKLESKEVSHGVMIHNGELFLPGDLFNRILEYSDRLSVRDMLHVNKEMSHYIRNLRWRDHKMSHSVIYDFVSREYGSAERLLQSIFNTDMLFPTSSSDKKERERAVNHLQLLLMNHKRFVGTLKRSVVLKCLIPHQEVDQEWFNSYPYSDLIDGFHYYRETMNVQIVFREKIVRHSLEELLVPESEPTSIFESLTGSYEVTVKNRPVETPISLYPIILYGPFVLEFDRSGLCIPKISMDDQYFSNLNILECKNASTESVAAFIAKWNTDQITAMKKNWHSVSPIQHKLPFLDQLAKHIKMKVAPVYRLLLREYGLFKTSNQFFESREMIYPVGPFLELEELKRIMQESGLQTNNIHKVNFKGETFHCVKFHSHKELDRFVYNIMEEKPVLSAEEVPDYNIFLNFDIVWLCRYKSVGTAILFRDDMKCIPHRCCRHKNMYM